MVLLINFYFRYKKQPLICVDVYQKKIYIDFCFERPTLINFYL